MLINTATPEHSFYNCVARIGKISVYLNETFLHIKLKRSNNNYLIFYS